MSLAARVRQDEADRLKAQAVALRPLARLEDLHLWQMEKVKTTKKGSRKKCLLDGYLEEGRADAKCPPRGRLEDSEEEALQKARGMKAEALPV